MRLSIRLRATHEVEYRLRATHEVEYKVESYS